MYTVDYRDEIGLVNTKRFNSLDEAEKFYYRTQLRFKYIELRLKEDNEVIDHCYMAGSKLSPIWQEI